MGKLGEKLRRWLPIACLAASAAWGLGRVLGERGLLASLLFYLPAPLVLLALAAGGDPAAPPAPSRFRDCRPGGVAAAGDRRRAALYGSASGRTGGRFAAVAAALERLPRLRRQPDFMAGDFNTPRTSRLLSPLDPGYRHAYDLAGRGWSYTWPTFLPVLSLDHLYVSDAAVVVARYQIESSPWSDHRLQRALLHRRPAN